MAELDDIGIVLGILTVAGKAATGFAVEPKAIEAVMSRVLLYGYIIGFCVLLQP